MADANLAPPSELMYLLRPPIVRSATASLDRALFSKTIPIAAARVRNLKNISKVRAGLEKSKELVKLDRLINVRPDPDPSIAVNGGKCLLLQPEVKPDDSSTWSTFLQEAVQKEDVGVVPYQLQLDYDYWSYHDIMSGLLPEEALGEIPVGFATAGHVAHLNLRDEYLPYKKVIAEVIVDKNPKITTVINKIDRVGAASEFRTFNYEVLAGPDDMNVELSEGNCIFKFDYSKVYWNTRLQTEHKRLIEIFQPGEVVCDVMAGIGPFAVPAGKKGVFVYANDLNPESYEALKAAITRNKVASFVSPFCQDGRTFIHYAADHLLSLTTTNTNTIAYPAKRTTHGPPAHLKPLQLITIPPTISHFVLNLPATAISFLPSFIGLYHNQEKYFIPNTTTKLPLIHVHCFSTKSEDNVRETKEICERISKELGVKMEPWSGKEKGGEWEGVKVHDVRDVAPMKRMFCASFRLPAEVAFRERVV